MVAPVTMAPSASAGSSSACSTRRRAASSKQARAGEEIREKAFWSQAVASQWAATLAGRAPPVTKPK